MTSLPDFLIADCVGTFDYPAGNGKNECKRHVCSVFGQYTWRIGDRDTAIGCCLNINIIDAGTEVRNQLQLVPGLHDDGFVDPVSYSGHQDFSRFDRFNEIALTHWRVGFIQCR